MGHSRAETVAVRCKAFRSALLGHWSLGDKLGAHTSTYGEAIAAAMLLGVEFDDDLDKLAFGNWGKHAAPPGAERLLAMHRAVRATTLEPFRETL